MFIDISQGREEGMENLSGETTTMGKQSKQALCVLLLKKCNKISCPEKASSTALAGATGWISGSELPNSSLTDFHYFTINEICLLCSALGPGGAIGELLAVHVHRCKLSSSTTPALFRRERLPFLWKVLV